MRVLKNPLSSHLRLLVPLLEPVLSLPVDLFIVVDLFPDFPFFCIGSSSILTRCSSLPQTKVRDLTEIKKSYPALFLRDRACWSLQVTFWNWNQWTAVSKKSGAGWHYPTSESGLGSLMFPEHLKMKVWQENQWTKGNGNDFVPTRTHVRPLFLSLESWRLSLQTGGEGQDPRSRKYSVKKPETMTSLLADTFRLT